MSKTNDRKQAAKQICDAAQTYKNDLVGKIFMYVFDNRYIEVMFKAANFKHLTGVDSNLSAKEFYKLAVKGKLQANQIYFSSHHPYTLAKRKLKHILNIAQLAKSESFLLENITTSTQTYKFGSTDLNFTLCFNQELINSTQQTPCFIVESLRDEDCFSKSQNVYTITHILSKKNDMNEYTDILYIENQKSVYDLPIQIKEKISAQLISRFSPQPKTSECPIVHKNKTLFSRSAQKAFVEKAAKQPVQQQNNKSKDDITH